MKIDPRYLSRRPRAGLEAIKAKRANWVAKRAARKAIFARPTPYATRLLSIAYVRRALYYVYVLVTLLVGARVVWRAIGADDAGTLFQVLRQGTDPLLGPFLGLLPVLQLGKQNTLELSALAALAAVALIFRLADRLVHTVGMWRPVR